MAITMKIAGLTKAEWEALYDEAMEKGARFTPIVRERGAKWAHDTVREGRCIVCNASAGIDAITIWKQGEEGYVSFQRRDFGCGH